jgi:hypothetical protein
MRDMFCIIVNAEDCFKVPCDILIMGVSVMSFTLQYTVIRQHM